jgi:hypothetical protein
VHAIEGEGRVLGNGGGGDGKDGKDSRELELHFDGSAVKDEGWNRFFGGYFY